MCTQCRIPVNPLKEFTAGFMLRVESVFFAISRNMSRELSLPLFVHTSCSWVEWHWLTVSFSASWGPLHQYPVYIQRCPKKWVSVLGWRESHINAVCEFVTSVMLNGYCCWVMCHHFTRSLTVYPWLRTGCVCVFVIWFSARGISSWIKFDISHANWLQRDFCILFLTYVMFLTVLRGVHIFGFVY